MVLSVIVVNSIIAKGPLVFLSLGQQLNGSYDAILSPVYYGSLAWGGIDSNNFDLFNYTHISELYEEDLNLSPRNAFFGEGSNSTATFEKGIHLVFLDTEREKQINIG